MTLYRMNGAFDFLTVEDLYGDYDKLSPNAVDEAVRFVWGELCNDMRDELPETLTREDLVLVRWASNGDDVNIFFEAPVTTSPTTSPEYRRPDTEGLPGAASLWRGRLGGLSV